MKAKFASVPTKKCFRLRHPKPNKIQLAFQSKSAGFTEWELEWNDDLWIVGYIVGYRTTENEPFETVAEVFGTAIPNKETQKEDALTMAMAMVTAMEESWDRCDWPELLRIAKEADDKTAYGE